MSDPDNLSAAARRLGSVRSERKKEAARERYERRDPAKKPIPLKALADIPCNCPGGPFGPDQPHRSTCYRARAIKRRLKKGLPLI